MDIQEYNILLEDSKNIELEIKALELRREQNKKALKRWKAKEKQHKIMVLDKERLESPTILDACKKTIEMLKFQYNYNCSFGGFGYTIKTGNKWIKILQRQNIVLKVNKTTGDMYKTRKKSYGSILSDPLPIDYIYS